MDPLSILLVEDNTDDEYIALHVLGKAGFHGVTVARDGMEALRLLFDETRALPRLLLLDLRLPKIDGLEVLRRIREDERLKQLPVTILSSSEDLKDKENCHRLGILAFLSKPIRLQQIQQVLDLLQQAAA